MLSLPLVETVWDDDASADAVVDDVPHIDVDGDAERDPLAEAAEDELADASIVRVAVSTADVDADCETDCEEDDDTVALELTLPDTAPDIDARALALKLSHDEALAVEDDETESLTDIDTVAQRVFEAHGVDVGVATAVEVDEAEDRTDIDKASDGTVVVYGDVELEGANDEVGIGVTEAAPLETGDAVVVESRDALREGCNVAEAEVEDDTELEGSGDEDCVAGAEARPDCEGVPLSEADTEPLRDGHELVLVDGVSCEDDD